MIKVECLVVAHCGIRNPSYDLLIKNEIAMALIK
jgi:hypothetical protein